MASKFGWPTISAISGMSSRSTIAVTTPVTATPMTNPTARSMKLPRLMNSLNSAITGASPCGARTVGAPTARSASRRSGLEPAARPRSGRAARGSWRPPALDGSPVGLAAPVTFSEWSPPSTSSMVARRGSLCTCCSSRPASQKVSRVPCRNRHGTGPGASGRPAAVRLARRVQRVAVEEQPEQVGARRPRRRAATPPARRRTCRPAIQGRSRPVTSRPRPAPVGRCATLLSARGAPRGRPRGRAGWPGPRGGRARRAARRARPARRCRGRRPRRG
jgi:hypothetical protein